MPSSLQGGGLLFAVFAGARRRSRRALGPACQDTFVTAASASCSKCAALRRPRHPDAGRAGAAERGAACRRSAARNRPAGGEGTPMQAACAPWGKLMAGAAGPNGRDLRMSDPLERQVEQLKETYWELAQEEGLGLGDFLERVQAGEWGQVAGEAIRRFLLDV